MTRSDEMVYTCVSGNPKNGHSQRTCRDVLSASFTSHHGGWFHQKGSIQSHWLCKPPGRDTAYIHIQWNTIRVYRVYNYSVTARRLNLSLVIARGKALGNRHTEGGHCQELVVLSGSYTVWCSVNVGLLIFLRKAYARHRAEGCDLA